jgi:multiple sugar transport system ATP-binding protein
VTHDQVEALSMGDQIGVLNEGNLVQTGTPYEIYNNPCNTFVALSVGSPAMNLFGGELVSGTAVVVPKNFELPVTTVLDSGVDTASRPLTFGIRPEDVHIESGAPVEAIVHDVENQGVEKILTLMVGENRLRATVPAQTKVVVDETIRFAWDPAKVILFDGESGDNLRQIG